MVFTEKTFSKCLSILNDLNAILFFNSNFGLACELCEEIKKTFQPEEQIIIDFQEDEKKFVGNLVNLLGDGFFASKKIIKVFNFKPDGRSAVMKELDVIKTQNFRDKLIIFFAPEIDGKSSVKTFFEKDDLLASISCYEDDNKTTAQYIEEYAKQNDIIIDDDAKIMLCEYLTGDRMMLKYELNKLKLFCNDKKKITLQDVELATQTTQNFNPNEFLDNVLSGNIVNAYKMFNLFKQEDQSIILLTRLFLKNTTELLQMLELVSQGNTIDEVIKMKFVFFKRIPLIKKILTLTNAKQLENMMKKILEIEKIAKLYGNKIAVSIFEKNIMLANFK